MTVERMLREMSGRELLEWRAFLHIERSGGLSQVAVDLDEKIKAAFRPFCVGNPQWQTESPSS